MKPVRKRLTYANVMSSIAVFLVVAGGSAFAANQLSKNSVGTKQIRANAVTTAKVKGRAVTSGKIGVGAVRGNQIADHSISTDQLANGSILPQSVAPNSLSSGQIKPGSITPASLEVPLSFVAKFGGGSIAVPSGEPAAYALNSATWTQPPGQINVVFGGSRATLAAEGGTCQVYVQLLQNGEEVGGGQIQTESESLAAVEGSLGANPQIGPLATKTNTLTAMVGSNGNCAPGSTIDSTRFEVIAFG